MRTVTRFLPLAALATLTALPAAGFTPDRAAIFVDALRANDCAMTGDEAPVALPPLGLAPDEVQQFVDILFTAGLVGLSDDMQVLTLSDALCAAGADESLAMIEAAYDAPDGVLEPWEPDFTPESGAALIGAVRENGCALTDEQAGQVLPAIGIDPTTSRDVVAVMLETELAMVDPDGSQLGLSEDLCAADPAQDAATIAAALAAFLEARAEAPQPAEESE